MGVREAGRQAGEGTEEKGEVRFGIHDGHDGCDKTRRQLPDFFT